SGEAAVEPSPWTLGEGSGGAGAGGGAAVVRGRRGGRLGGMVVGGRRGVGGVGGGGGGRGWGGGRAGGGGVWGWRGGLRRGGARTVGGALAAMLWGQPLRSVAAKAPPTRACVVFTPYSISSGCVAGLPARWSRRNSRRLIM